MFDIVTDFLKHIAEDASSEHVSLMLSQLDMERLKAEARKAVPVLESYVEPVLPFRDVTEEQIEKERESIDRQYGFVIWSDALYSTDEDCARRVNEDPEQFLGMSEDEVRQMSFEAGQEDLDLLKGEMLNAYGASVVVIGTIGRWNGTMQCWKFCTDIRDAFGALTGDQCTVYLKDGEIRMENVHHDGTDSFMVRRIKPGVDLDDLEDRCTDCVMDATESLASAMCSYFGWTP